jgi:hypothetical protein
MRFAVATLGALSDDTVVVHTTCILAVLLSAVHVLAGCANMWQSLFGCVALRPAAHLLADAALAIGAILAISRQEEIKKRQDPSRITLCCAFVNLALNRD